MYVPATSQQRSSALRVLLAALALIGILAGLKLAAPFVVPVILAFFIAVTSLPLVRWLSARGIPRPLSMFLMLLFYLALLVAVALLVASLVSEFQSKWVNAYQFRLRQTAANLVVWLESSLGAAGVEGVRSAFDNMVNIEALLILATDNVGRVFSMLTGVVQLTLLVLLLVGFMLADAETFVKKLPAVQRAGGPEFEMWKQLVSDIRTYLGIKTLISAVTGLSVWFLCAVVGLDFALLWGLVAFVLNYIPVIGSIVASIPAILLALIQFGWTQLFIVAVGYFAINTLFGSIIEPLMHGQRFGISAVVVLISVLFWGWLLGAAGMFLAVPLTLLLKSVLNASPELRWIAALLESEKRLATFAQSFVGKVKRGISEQRHAPAPTPEPQTDATLTQRAPPE